jgi:uncharacterized membrane protein YeaQ/YmgE (transglycosylase-associated protein family)
MKASNLIPGVSCFSNSILSNLFRILRPSARTFGFRLSAVAGRQDLRPSVLALLALLALSTLPAAAADDSSVSQKANQTMEETKKATSDSLDKLWKSVDEARLKNRSPDEIVAWVIMGVLAGSLAAMVTSLKTPGKIGSLACGLAGAFIGGIIVNLVNIDFGWGPVLIRYEELLFSLVGAVLFVVLLKLFGLKKLM